MNYGKTATTLVQKYVRLRDTDEHGYGYCCCCRKLLQYGTSDCQGGHFNAKGRHYNGACCLEENVNLQCSGCNSFKNVEAEYAKYMVERYGEGIISKIALASKIHLTKEEFKVIIEEYKAKIKELAKTKMFLVK
jgi:hypothetical protein